MNLKKRDMGLVAIVLIALIAIIIVITMQPGSNTTNETDNTNFNNGNTQTAAAEFTGYVARTYWAEDQGVHVVHHFEDVARVPA